MLPQQTRPPSTDTIVWGDITAIDTLIDGIVADIGVFPSANYATLAAYVEDIRTRLIAIVADTGAIAWGDVTTLLTRLSAARAGNLDQLDFALQEAIAALQTDLDNPAQYRADLTGLAEQATLLIVAGYLDTEITAIINAIATAQADLDNPAQYKADVSALATAAKLEDAMQKATGPAWNQDTDSLEAIREVCDSIVTKMS